MKKLGKIADNINELDLSFSNVNDKMLSVVKQFKHLQKLELQNTLITSSALKNLEGLQFLRDLNLYRTQVDDRCFNSLENIKSLKSVYLWQSKVTDSNVETFASAYPSIHIFFPHKITVSSSTDGNSFNEIMSLQIPIAEEPNPSDYKSFLLQFEPHEAQFLRVAIFGNLKNPEWHAAPGAKTGYSLMKFWLIDL